jgi:hypothetical protein
VATTYTRIKNRRGLKADLPQPLADGEIGLALDTRELYIGVGNQDNLNTDVQVKNDIFNIKAFVTEDLGGNVASNGILLFKVSGTNVFSGDGSTTDFALGSNNGMPTNHPLSSPTVSDIVVTKFVNGIPTTLETTQYELAFSGGNGILRFQSPNIPETGSKILVCKWTKARITEAVRARANWEASNNAVASYNYWQENDLNNNQVYVDTTTGTGFVEYTSGSEYTALTTGSSDCFDGTDGKINVPTSVNGSTTYGTFLGENSAIHTPVRAIEINSSLKIDLDTPRQAFNVTKYINKKRGSAVARVANNVEIFTEASYPQYQTNQYIGSMQTATLTASGNGTVLEYLLTEANVYKIDYSLSLGSNYRTGTIYITTDGTNTAINDMHVETNATADVTFSAAISSSKLQFKYANANASIAKLSYKIERWLQPA